MPHPAWNGKHYSDRRALELRRYLVSVFSSLMYPLRSSPSANVPDAESCFPFQASVTHINSQKTLDEACIFVIYLIGDVTGLFFMPKIL